MLEWESKNKSRVVYIISIYTTDLIWRDVRVVEGARLESVYRGNSIRSSNLLLSARAVLDGESAVPCNLQSATAGLNS